MRYAQAAWAHDADAADRSAERVLESLGQRTSGTRQRKRQAPFETYCRHVTGGPVRRPAPPHYSPGSSLARRRLPPRAGCSSSGALYLRLIVRSSPRHGGAFAAVPGPLRRRWMPPRHVCSVPHGPFRPRAPSGDGGACAPPPLCRARKRRATRALGQMPQGHEDGPRNWGRQAGNWRPVSKLLDVLPRA